MLWTARPGFMRGFLRKCVGLRDLPSRDVTLTHSSLWWDVTRSPSLQSNAFDINKPTPQSLQFRGRSGGLMPSCRSTNPSIPMCQSPFCPPWMALPRDMLTCSVWSWDCGCLFERDPLLRMWSHPPPYEPSASRYMRGRLSGFVCGTLTGTRHGYVNTWQGAWWPCTTLSSYPLWSGTGQESLYLRVWPEILWFPGRECVPPIQGRRLVGTPLRGTYTLSWNNLPLPGWHAAKSSTPVGGTSAGPCMRPAGACVPPLPFLWILLPSHAPSPPATPLGVLNR